MYLQLPFACDFSRHEISYSPTSAHRIGILLSLRFHLAFLLMFFLILLGSGIALCYAATDLYITAHVAYSFPQQLGYQS